MKQFFVMIALFFAFSFTMSAQTYVFLDLEPAAYQIDLKVQELKQLDAADAVNRPVLEGSTVQPVVDTKYYAFQVHVLNEYRERMLELGNSLQTLNQYMSDPFFQQSRMNDTYRTLARNVILASIAEIIE